MTRHATGEEILRRLGKRESLSVELPAGAGKTELIAALVQEAYAQRQRTLVLTHTHAGVDALKARIHRRYSVPREFSRVRTIAGWAFELIRSYPILGGYKAPSFPDFTQSEQYYRACVSVLKADAIREVISRSYDAVIVDEYQDCVAPQHRVVLALEQIVPTIVFGDSLQSLFHFNGNRPVDWERDVLPHFAAIDLPHRPWRWHHKNAELGDWLTEVRASLTNRQSVDLSTAPVTYVKLPQKEWRAQAYRTAYANLNVPDLTVAALGKWPRDLAIAASLLGGEMQVMEEIEGKVMRGFAEELSATPDERKAASVVDFAKRCALGVTKVVDNRKLSRVREGKHISTRISMYAPLYQAINLAVDQPTPAAMKQILDQLSGLNEIRIFCFEAWSEVAAAMELSHYDDTLTLLDAVIRRREILRRQGRKSGMRIVSRPLLVKGLEFDHVILLNADAYNCQELYVALTRASRALTIFSRSPMLSPHHSW